MAKTDKQTNIEYGQKYRDEHKAVIIRGYICTYIAMYIYGRTRKVDIG